MRKLVLYSFAMLGFMGLNAVNPVVKTTFTPDPAPYVHNDTVYLFTGHDEDDAQYFKMKDWQLFSTTDLVNWTYRGTPLSTEHFKWAKQGDNAWASQAVERNGKWYWYVCAEDTTCGLHGIGVAVADRPEGPYKDPLGKPLVPGSWGYIDPTVFIDDDGKAYLFWGNNGLWYAELNDDMISLASEVKPVAHLDRPESFGPQRMKHDYQLGKKVMKTNFEEGPWLNKRNGIYYLSYAAGGVPEHMAYSTSRSVHGPWKYGGRIMNESPGSFTIHGGNITIGGRDFMFYHQGFAPNGSGFRRAAAVEEFEWVGDSIPLIPFTDAGIVKPLRNLDPFLTVEAETMSDSWGVKTDRRAGSSHYITSIHNGDWTRLKNVDFGKGAASLVANVLNVKNPGTIEFIVEGVDKPFAVIPVIKDGEIVVDVNPEVTGVKDLMILFRGGDEEMFDFDSWYLGL